MPHNLTISHHDTVHTRTVHLYIIPLSLLYLYDSQHNCDVYLDLKCILCTVYNSTLITVYPGYPYIPYTHTPHQLQVKSGFTVTPLFTCGALKESPSHPREASPGGRQWRKAWSSSARHRTCARRARRSAMRARGPATCRAMFRTRAPTRLARGEVQTLFLPPLS